MASSGRSVAEEHERGCADRDIRIFTYETLRTDYYVPHSPVEDLRQGLIAVGGATERTS
jgi:hypothetical protein